jgi:hypothetical protein
VFGLSFPAMLVALILSLKDGEIARGLDFLSAFA